MPLFITMNAPSLTEESEDGGNNETQIKMTLKGKTYEMFAFLKEHYNLGYNAEVIRLLIKQGYDLLNGDGK